MAAARVVWSDNMSRLHISRNKENWLLPAVASLGYLEKKENRVKFSFLKIY